MADEQNENELDMDALAPFVRDGRLQSYPRKGARRLQILRWLAQGFEPGRAYREPEVNAILAGHALDYATLRRYLVDAGLLVRAEGLYRRGANAPAAAPAIGEGSA